MYQPLLSFLYLFLLGSEFYVCDYRGQAVVVFSRDGSFEGKITREATGSEWRPTGITITEKGAIVVADCHADHLRLVSFDPTGRELSSSVCPDYKVSVSSQLIYNSLRICALFDENPFIPWLYVSNKTTTSSLPEVCFWRVQVWRAGGIEVTSEGFVISIARYENALLVMRSTSGNL